MKILTASCLALLAIPSTGQNKGLNQSIRNIRMGKITVKANPGNKIEVQQSRYEFWFGCAIPIGLFF